MFIPGDRGKNKNKSDKQKINMSKTLKLGYSVLFLFFYIILPREGKNNHIFFISFILQFTEI